MAARVIEQDVLEVLSGCEVEGNVVRIRQQLPRPLYERVDKVLQALGGRWDGRKTVRGHVFTRPAAVAIDDACLTGTYEKWTVGGWFPTPIALAQVVVSRAAIRPGERVLEPSAGEGALALPAAALAGELGHVQCVEQRPEHVATLRRLGFLNVVEGDFLGAWVGVHGFAVYDRVVMNPPFEQLADVRHVRHAFGFLRPGGRLVAIMSPGWTFRQEVIAQEFRSWAKDVEADWTMLPEGSFKESGTMVRAGILVVDRDGA